jgi:molybdopterin-guanine dinucleotide biosynthesis protein A
MKNTILVIMAGGKSSRMQQDKALLPFGGYNSLAEYQYKRFKPLFGKVYISAKTDKFDFAVDIIEDCYSDSSPLVGLVSIFKQLKDIDGVIVVSVDAPFINKKILNTLLDRAKKEQKSVVAESLNGIEPLCAFYRKEDVLCVAEAMIEKQKHRLQRLLASIQYQKIFFKETDCFMNLNYPSDYDCAKRLSSNI